jgi:hypothetical protein
MPSVDVDVLGIAGAAVADLFDGSAVTEDIAASGVSAVRAAVPGAYEVTAVLSRPGP